MTYPSRGPLRHIGELIVYPGHPVTLAYLIVQTFPTFEAAFEKESVPGGSYEAALCSGEIPGAGGSVHAALRLLWMLRREGGFDEAVMLADRQWANTDDQARSKDLRLRQRFEEGQRQADRWKQPLRACSAWWTEAGC